MANTFKQATKSSLVTDAVSSSNTNVLTAGNSSTVIILNSLVANKTSTNANVDVYLVPSSGDDVYLLKSVPVPAGSSLELINQKYNLGSETLIFSEPSHLTSKVGFKSLIKSDG